MKLKVLLFPSLVVIIIALLIWVVYPAYSNGTNGLKEKLQELKAEKKNLADIDFKNENISSLSSQIAADTVGKDVLFKYIPDGVKEEEIIDNLNYLAGKENLFVYGLDVSRVKTVEVEVEPSTVTLRETEGLTSPKLAAATIPWPKASDLKVNLSAIGKYSGIKSMLDKIYNLDRFNQVLTAEIKKPTVAGKDAGDNLELNVAFNFNFLKRINALADLNNEIFSSKSFNLKVISDIENQKSTSMLNLEVGPTGKSNPFFP